MLCSRVKVMEFDEQIPDSLLPFLVFSLFRLGDAPKYSFFQGIKLLLRELDQFVAELYVIVRFHDMTFRTKQNQFGITGCSWDDRVPSEVGSNERNGGRRPGRPSRFRLVPQRNQQCMLSWTCEESVFTRLKTSSSTASD